MNSKIETPVDQPTVTFNNKSYMLNALPREVQDLVNYHQTWTEELTQARREVFKLEAALRGLLSELEARFNAVDATAKALIAESS